MSQTEEAAYTRMGFSLILILNNLNLLKLLKFFLYNIIETHCSFSFK